MANRDDPCPRGARWRGLLADIRRTETALGRERLGCFAIEGIRLHERALRADRVPERVLMSGSFREHPSARVRRLVRDIERSGCHVAVAPDEVLVELTGGRDVGAIVGLVRQPPRRTLRDIRAARPEGGFSMLVGVDVEDPGNVGALVRTALASGAAAYASVGLGDPYHPRAVRTSMGSVLKLPMLRYDSLRELWGECDREGLVRIGAVSSGGAPLPTASFDADAVAVLVGSEAFGLPRDAVRLLDARVTVPMPDGVDSFSVNAAAAIVLYEVGRRRPARREEPERHRIDPIGRRTGDRDRGACRG